MTQVQNVTPRLQPQVGHILPVVIPVVASSSTSRYLSPSRGKLDFLSCTGQISVVLVFFVSVRTGGSWWGWGGGDVNILQRLNCYTLRLWSLFSQGGKAQEKCELCALISYYIGSSLKANFLPCTPQNPWCHWWAAKKKFYGFLNS